MVLDASQPSDLLDSFYACNTHVVCIASVPGTLTGDIFCFVVVGLVGFFLHRLNQLWMLTVTLFVCFSGVLESDFSTGEEVPQDVDANQGDVVSLAGSVASVGSTGSDGAMAAEGATAVPQIASSGITDQPAEHSAISGSGSYLQGKKIEITSMIFISLVCLNPH